MPEKIKILLVEDDEGHAKLVSKAFRGLEGHYRVFLASNLQQAREYLEKETPDIIVTDLILPDGRGSDLLIPSADYPKYPLVVMTSYGDEQVAVEAMKGGALDYIVKSAITLKAMPRVVQRVLREWGHILTRRMAEEELKKINDRLEEAVKNRTKDLEKSYHKLLQEILERKRTQQELQKYKNQLEELVDERTKQLEAVNKQLEEANKRLAEANIQLERLANYDALTGIANRRYFIDTLENEWKRAIRNKQALSLIMIDVDFFKNYNDNKGHQAGDDCLKQIATILQESVIRSGDMLARYGGEEFMIVLPVTDLEGAMAFAEKIRQRLEDTKITHEFSSISSFVTISLGCASTIPTAKESVDLLIAKADQALYKAKRNGRNRCEVD